MKYSHLTCEQRRQIYTLKMAGKKQKEIAEKIGVSPSTISREISRNSGLRGYRYKQAHAKAVEKVSNARSGPIRMIPSVVKLIEKKLRQRLSPAKISLALKEKGISISHERIYLHVWEDKKLGGDLYQYLKYGDRKYNRGYTGRARRS